MKTYYAKVNRETYIAEYLVKAKDKADAARQIYEISGERGIQIHEK